MVHSEWNHGDVETRAYILVYSTDPVPATASFHVLRDAEAPRYDDGDGVRTKELVGPRSPLRVNGDVRLFADSNLEPGSVLRIEVRDGEGGVASVRDGEAGIEGGPETLAPGQTLVIPPAHGERSIGLRAIAPSRIIRVVHGPGQGLVRGRPLPRRGGR